MRGNTNTNMQLKGSFSFFVSQFGRTSKIEMFLPKDCSAFMFKVRRVRRGGGGVWGVNPPFGIFMCINPPPKTP